MIFPDENGGIDRFLYDPVQRLTGSWLSVPNGTPSGCIFCDDFDQGSTCLWSAEEPPANCFNAPESPEALRRSQLYTFDEYGNIQSIETDGSLLQTTTSESTNRLSSQGAIFDARGNLTTWSSTSFVYDALNRMSRRVVAGEPEYHFLYTADDERILSVAAPPGAGSLEFHWTLRDFGGKVLREYVNTPTALVPAHDYIFRGDQPLGEVDFTTPSPTTYHLTLDHLGTPRLKTSTTGAVVQKWKYFPFGEEAVASAQAGTALRFTGHERDRFNLGGVADDVDYMHARHRNIGAARFQTTDPHRPRRPLIAPQIWNQYSYAGNSPMVATDSNGREIVLQVQKVAGNNFHASVRIEPKDQASYAADPRFSQVNPSTGRRFATLGAGPDLGGSLYNSGPPSWLKSDVNRERDADMNIKVEQRSLDLGGRDENSVIGDLFSADRNYSDNAKYSLFPAGFSDSYNSNSYASGLLLAVELALPEMQSNLPGFDKPLPEQEFDATNGAATPNTDKETPQ